MARVSGNKPKQIDQVLASNEVNEGYISSLAGIEFTEYENPEKSASYYMVVYGLNNDYINTIKCESSFQHDGLYGDHGLAYGIAQFHEDTFKQFCEGDYKNMQDQLNCAAQMINRGLGNHWSCYKRITK